MEDEIFANKVVKKVKKEFAPISIKKDEYYYHPTFYIKDLASYIRLITLISSINSNTIYDETVVYRGMVDQGFDLRPGLARYMDLFPGMEKELINDFLTRRPNEFMGLSDFDIIAKMQHYGLPTRFLDFSRNPLVALYFACESKTSTNGRVLCHSTYLKNDSSEWVKAICAAAIKKEFDENYTIEEYVCNEKLTLKKYMQETYLFKETIVVRPKYWNQRIANQSGVFMVFPNDLADKYYPVLIHSEDLGLEKAIQEYGRGAIEKKYIEIALNREPIDFYKDCQSCYVTDEYFWKLYESYCDEKDDVSVWEIIKRRFNTDCMLKDLSFTKISNDFCSIIVESKRKRKILKELSYIGITSDYIYPELEYTAQEIKRRFE